MNGHENEERVFEIGVVIPKRVVSQEEDESCDCSYVLLKEFEKVGFEVERVIGIADEFIKLAAPLETLGRAAAELQIKKRTHIGISQIPRGGTSVMPVNNSDSAKILKFDGKEIHWESGENLLLKLESENIVKQAIEVGGAYCFLRHGDTLGYNVFSVLEAWPVSSLDASDQGNKTSGRNAGCWQPPMELMKVFESDKVKEKEAFQKSEWLGRLMRFRNDAIIIFSIICLQLPFELAYAHLYEILDYDIIKFGLTAVYLFAIQYITKIGGNMSVKLIMKENNENTEKQADSLVYKVFGLYFMQTYIGIFYHALLHRNFKTLRRVLIQRLLLSEVLENLLENLLPYLKYSYKKYSVRHKKGEESEQIQFTSRVEKEYLKPSYSASIGDELEDGLFDDFLELALQFGMILMFACAFPPAFVFAAVNNIMEIRTDAFKLLAILRRPVPRAAATVGAWHNIFQFLILMAICTNCALLAWLYDEERKWKIEPGLAAILIMEHVLVLIKFGFSRLVPEEPAWVRASRAKRTSHAQNMCSKKLLRTISGVKKNYKEEKKLD
ncbi:unnamed protein product [Sphenostylis stenocarpa]|uniref:Anoctamin transmembrane domain-containing protein n=1 Tax=Sphenostylis stenocarpa TaxID=92480 RepID=A0AA86SS22_9FABA|nr:unnamed protein product [Sphenostylis stenocarpa]